MKNSCYYCLEDGAVDSTGGTPSTGSNGPFKPCPVCKLDNTKKLMDDILLSEVKDLHMNKFVWALDIVKDPAIKDTDIQQLISSINHFVYCPSFPSEPAIFLGTHKEPKKFYRLVFHGTLIYSDIVGFLKRLNIDYNNSVVTLNRIETKDYL